MKTNEEPQTSNLALEGDVSDRHGRLRNILVALDFSSFSKRGLDYALFLAKRLGSKLTLIHVVEPTIVPDTLMVTAQNEVDMRIVRERQETLDLLARNSIDPSIPSESIVKTGVPSEEIIEEAILLRSDLIVLASHGHSALRDVLLGNTAERVVRHAHCSVLIIRPEQVSHAGSQMPSLTLRKILVPVDFSAASEQALAKAVLLARMFKAEIILSHVIETDKAAQMSGYISDGVKAADPEKILGRLGQNKIPSDISRQISVKVGRPFKAIAEAAETLQADLIIIASHGHNTLKWTLLGTTAERVVRHSPCAVWVLRD